MSADADANGSALTGLSAVVVETRQEDDVDKFEDVVNKVTEPFKQVHEIYTSNSDAIHAAITALASLGGDFGRALDNWVPVVDKVMDGLDGLAKSTAFPFVGVAVYLFKGVVQLETQRRENSKRARALILQMADMLGALLQLDGVQDPDLKDQKTGQTVGGRIQRLMSAIEGDIKDCGNLIDAYSKHSVASKFFFSGQYADKFKSRADGLVSRKGEIIFSLQIHNTVGIDAIQAEVRRTNQMLTKLIEVVDHPSERKDRLDRMMHDLGGRDKVLGDDALMTTVASAVIQSRASPNAALSADQTDGAKIAGKEDAILTATERHELRLPLDSVLEQNATLYVEKLDRQVEKITSQLDKLQSSSDVILKTLTGGAWERVEHPDLQQIWKDNDWKTSVEARYFVLVVHDYYDDFFRRPQPAAPTADTTSTDGKQPRFSVPTPSDIWCLKYLSVKHTGALMEVFDVDGSGFVRVAEVNDFCAAIPEGVNLLQWLAYWAHGWRGETAIYAHKIIGLLQKMRAMLDDVLLENNRIVQRYFQGSKWVKDLESLTYMAAQFPHSTGTPLDALIARAMDRKAAAQLPLLEKLYYTIDTPESVDLVCESLRLEVDILPLLYRILSHHAGLIVLCKTTVIDEREFTSAADTIKQVLRAVKSRVDKLDGMILSFTVFML
ncbi:hypothetical protein DL93DRAFT_1295443 [Clavulina sp. PMI_390]|nr:hypothetical protein DL93DRAFT_1295443 [Clavulina sp. PMI_390]